MPDDENVDAADRKLIERYFDAMRTGASSSDDIIDMFAEDAVYTEPFTGRPTAHVGKQEIRRSFVESQAMAPPDMTLSLDRIELAGECIRTSWTCSSPAFAYPMHGLDIWTIRNGKIHRLETRFIDPHETQH